MSPHDVDVEFMEQVFVAMCRLCIALILAALVLMYCVL